MEVHGAKKILDMNILPEKHKIVLQNKKIIENKPRMGQGGAAIRHKNHQPVESITASTSKSCEIPKKLMTQDVAKNRMDFPVQQQSITSKTEPIMRGMIQHKNRELLLYPDLIYGPPSRPTRQFITTKSRK